MTDTRQNIINSAKHLFYAHSYGNVGVQAICTQANVKKGSFYHFFRSKRDLTLAVIDDLVASFEVDVLLAAFRNNSPPLQRFDDFLERLYHFHLNVKQQQGLTLGCPFGNLALEMSTQDETLRQHLDRVFIKIEGTFQNTLEAAIAREQIEATLDTAKTASAMFAYIEGITLLAKTRDNPELIRTLGKAMCRIRILTTEEAQTVH